MTTIRSITISIAFVLITIFSISLLTTPSPTSASSSNPTTPQTTTKNPAGGCGLNWRNVPVTSGSSSTNRLLDAYAFSPNDIWAVGAFYETINTYEYARGMIQHWNGTEWSLISWPLPGAQSYFNSISALAPNDIWAVGTTSNSVDFGEHSLAVHYDGTSWTVVPTPDLGAHNFISSISMLSPTSGWASISYDSTTGALYWDGTSWASVPSSFPASTYPFAIVALSADDMWIAGYHQPSPQNYTNFVAHCTRAQCSEVTVPNPGLGSDGLYNITALSPTEIYAVGFNIVGSGPVQYGPLVLRYNGSGWSALPQPDQPAGLSWSVNDIVAFSSTNIWVFGIEFNPNGSTQQTLALQWNGSSWYRYTTPGYYSANFTAAVAISPDDIWVVGHVRDNNDAPLRPLANHYSDPCTPTSTPTFTPAPQPTSTPATCTINFSDVPPGSPFYPYVLCLYCRNIIGGYPDNTFRPGNPVTRGQLSKIVSEAAAFSDDPGPQLFEDIPVGSTFYTWVNRLSIRSIINGYPCGGLGEPCGDTNLPYFRPNSTSTRGQIAKIVSLARGFTDPPGSPLFADVPEGSTFYDYIQRLANSSVMSGYPCGADPNEPCGPTNLPYFRPSNQATRGQTSKIISNTFFPGCSTR